MDWMTFVLEVLKAIVEVVKAGAWPAVTFFIAIRYHRPILDLVKKLTKAKAFGAELEFDRKIQEVAADAQELPKLEDLTPKPPLVANEEQVTLPGFATKGTDALTVSSEQIEIRELRRLIVGPDQNNNNHSHTILFAWNIVEKAMRRLLEAQGFADARIELPPASASLLAMLQQRKSLPNEHLRLIRKLRELRNSVAHATESDGPSKMSAYEYVVSAEKAIDFLAMRAEIPF